MARCSNKNARHRLSHVHNGVVPSSAVTQVILSLLPRDIFDNQLEWQDAVANDNDSPVDLSRLYYFDVVLAFLVARVISRLHKTLQYQDGVWRNCALIHDDERQSVGLLLLEQEDEHVDGTLMVRIQSSSQLAALRLLDHIGTRIHECLKQSPGVKPNYLFECCDCQPDCRQRLDQIASDAVTIDIVASVGKEPKTRCTRHYLNEYSPRAIVTAILEKGGHVTPHSENVPSAMLPYSDDILQAIRDFMSKAQSKNEVSQEFKDKAAILKDQLASTYPFLYLPVPSKDPQKWYSAFTKDQLFLLPLCEFSVPGNNLFHPVQGVQPQQLTGDLANIPKELWDSMRIASPLLESQKEAVNNNIKITPNEKETVLHLHRKNFLKIYHREIQEHGSSGNKLHFSAPRLAENALECVQNMFGKRLVR